MEGSDDEHVVRHLFERHQPELTFSIKRKDGLQPLLSSIGPEVRVDGLEALGIVVDANDNLTNRWTSIVDRLQREGIQPDVSPDSIGAVIHTPDKPSVGIWLMPDNQSTGELEDFVAKMIPDGDPVWPRSQSYIDDIPQGHRKFASGKTLRAKVHAWLATRREPRLMGAATGAGDLEVDRELSRKFVGWLTRLFQ